MNSNDSFFPKEKRGNQRPSQRIVAMNNVMYENLVKKRQDIEPEEMDRIFPVFSQFLEARRHRTSPSQSEEDAWEDVFVH